MPYRIDSKGLTFHVDSPSEFLLLPQLFASYYALPGTVYLNVDVDLSGHLWEPIGTFKRPFKWTLYGNGKRIKNLRTEAYWFPFTGLLGFFSGTVNELILENFTVRGRSYAGALCGFCFGGSVSRVGVINAYVQATLYCGTVFGGMKAAKVSELYVNFGSSFVRSALDRWGIISGQLGPDSNVSDVEIIVAPGQIVQLFGAVGKDTRYSVSRVVVKEVS